MNEKKVRKAVGAIVFQNDQYLLVHKVMCMDSGKGIEGIWDFPKGGIDKQDLNSEQALLRELKEETGSEAYRVIQKFEQKLCFNFPRMHKYDCQETIMYYVEYLGDGSDLVPQDKEISEIRFFDKAGVMENISLPETIEFFSNVI